jgi:hypothetical protein
VANQVDVTIMLNDIDECGVGIEMYASTGTPMVAMNRFGSSVTTPIVYNDAHVYPTYAATNVTTDRSFDADTVAVAELADVVGTLISDLRQIGILK